MKFSRRLMASLLSISMIFSAITIHAEEKTVEDPELYYVALGDSITAGYSLPDTDTSTIISAYTNYKNDSTSAYPNIVANQLKEYTNYQGDLYDMYSNLGSCGMTMADFLEALDNPEYYLQTIANAYGVDPDLLKYYKLYREELAKADVITLYCGNNDIASDFETQFGKDALGTEYVTVDYDGTIVYDNVANPMLTLIWQLTIDYTMGVGEIAANNALAKRLNYYLREDAISKIDLESTLTAMEYVSTEGLTESMVKLIEQAESQFPELVEKIRKINPDADLLLVGFYCPYGNSLEADGINYNMNNLVQTLFSKVISIFLPGSNLDEIIGSIGGGNPDDSFVNNAGEIIDEVNEAIGLDFSYPALYLIAGLPLQTAVEHFNNWLQSYADSIGCGYVDIYEIPNDTDVDPHPTAEGHAYIASQIIDAYNETITCTVTGSGTATVTGPKEVYYKQEATFTITPTNGSELEKVLVNGKEVKLDQKNSFTIYPEKDTTIEVVTHKYGTYTVSYEGSGNATINGPARLELNTPVTFTVNCESGSYVDYVKVNGTKINVTDNQFTVNTSVASTRILVHAVSTKQVSVEYIGYGDVKVVGPDSADYNTAVTYTLEIGEGSKVTQVDVNGSPVKVTDNSFTVTVKGSVSITVYTERAFPFTDVSQSKWYYGSIYNVYQLGLMTGTSATTFDPSSELTRGMLVTILYRMAGSPEVTFDASIFPDVPEGKYYSNAIIWAQSVGVVNGYSDGTFRPRNNVNRQELTIMLRNYAKLCGKDVESDVNILNYYPDGTTVSGYAKESMAWAIETGLVSGSNGYLNPKGNATRGQAAKMILATYNYINE